MVISISVALVYMAVPAVVPNVYQSQEIYGEKIYCGCILTIIINKSISWSWLNLLCNIFLVNSSDSY